MSLVKSVEDVELLNWELLVFVDAKSEELLWVSDLMLSFESQLKVAIEEILSIFEEQLNLLTNLSHNSQRGSVVLR